MFLNDWIDRLRKKISMRHLEREIKREKKKLFADLGIEPGDDLEEILIILMQYVIDRDLLSPKHEAILADILQKYRNLQTIYDLLKEDD